MKTTTAVAALAAIAHDSRLAVFRLLVQKGPQGLAATKIAQALGIAPSSLSFHLKELAHADLVCATPAGRSIIYTANFSTMNALLAYLSANCCGDADCLRGVGSVAPPSKTCS